jgi:hypothetical protein
VAFIFGGLLSQNVTFEGLAAFNGSTGTDAEAFLRRALGLHFGHLHAPFSIVLVRRTENFSVLVGPEPLGGNRPAGYCYLCKPVHLMPEVSPCANLGKLTCPAIAEKRLQKTTLPSPAPA